MFVSIIFPCYNEEQAIPYVLTKIIKNKQKIIKNTNIKSLQIIIVNDGSTDNSFKFLQLYKKEVHIISMKKNTGYGAAIKQGIKQASGDWIAFCDLDASCNPTDIISLIQLIYNNKTLHAVWGNRLHKKSQMPWIRKLGNRLYQMIFLSLTFKYVPDMCSGFRLFKKSVFISFINRLPHDLSFSLALSVCCIRYKIPFLTINISYGKRLGKSKLYLLKDGFVFLKTLIKYLFFKNFNNLINLKN